MSNSVLVRAVEVAQHYGKVVALEQASCQVSAGDRIALLGSSGSGKSTLLHLLGGLNLPSSGTVDWPALGPVQGLRPGKVAFVFQAQSLLAPLSALENAALPLLLLGTEPQRALAHANALLERLGLGNVMQQLPEELSGGQAQRVAVARALVTGPQLILADEPTGQLDSVNARRLMDVLIAECDRLGAALVVATHDPQVATRLSEARLGQTQLGQVWQMARGVLVPDEVAA